MILCWSKTTIKALQQNVKLVQTFFISHLATHFWATDKETNLLSITTLFQGRLEGHRESHNEVGLHILTKHISRILSKRALEKTGYRVASVFSRNYRSFALSLNTSNFEQVNVDRKILG